MHTDPHIRRARRVRGYEFEDIVPWSELIGGMAADE